MSLIGIDTPSGFFKRSAENKLLLCKGAISMPIHSRKNERFRGWNGYLSGYKGSTPAESFVY